MCSRSQGTPWNWNTCVSSCAQIQRSNESASTSSSRTALARLGPTNSRRGRRRRPAATPRTGRARAGTRSPSRGPPRRPPWPPRRFERARQRARELEALVQPRGHRVEDLRQRVEVRRRPLGSAHQLGRRVGRREREAACSPRPAPPSRPQRSGVDRRWAPQLPRQRPGARPAGRATSRPFGPESSQRSRGSFSSVRQLLLQLGHRREQVAVLARRAPARRRPRTPARPGLAASSSSQSSGVETVGRSRARSE